MNDSAGAIMQLFFLLKRKWERESLSRLPSSSLANGSDSCTRKETHVVIMDTFVLVVVCYKSEKEEMNAAKSGAKDLIRKCSLL